MAIIKQTKLTTPLLAQNKSEPLSPGGLLLKKRLSHIESYAYKAKEGNDYWNALASSHFCLVNEQRFHIEQLQKEH